MAMPKSKSAMIKTSTCINVSEAVHLTLSVDGSLHQIDVRAPRMACMIQISLSLRASKTMIVGVEVEAAEELAMTAVIEMSIVSVPHLERDRLAQACFHHAAPFLR